MAEIELTQFQLGIIVAILWIGVVVLIIGIYWIRKKYPAKKEKLDPIYKGVFLILIVFLIHITAVAIGVLTRESLEKNLHWYAVAIVVAIAFYSLVSYFATRIIPSHKLWKKYVMPEVKKFWNAEPYKGVGYGDSLTYHRVFQVGKTTPTLLREKAIEGDVVQVFLGKAFFANIFFYIAVANKKTGEIIMLHKNPPLSIKQQLLGKDFTTSYEQALEEYDTSKEQQDIEVQR